MYRANTDQGSDGASSCAPRDGDVASLVAARMRRSGYPFLWSIKCQVCDDVAVLSGTVPTFYLKQLAQELAARTQGVQEVQNDVHVTGATNRTPWPAAAG